MEPQQDPNQPQPTPTPGQQPPQDPGSTPSAGQNHQIWEKDTPHEQAAAEQTFHVARPLAPAAPTIPAEYQRRHEESKRKYPSLNLSPGEFVIRAIKRHPIGLLGIWGIVAFLMIAIFGGAVVLASGLSGANTASLGSSGPAVIYTGAFLLSALMALGGFIATYVYENNRFYLTNESVVQEIQISLFAKKEQTVSLANIEDASYHQSNLLEMLFNYGDIRLSTEGDETTYHFTYVGNPKQHIAVLNNAVEAFKLGRPVSVGED